MTYHSGNLWPKKVFGEEFSYENYFFLSVNSERESDDVRVIWIEGSSNRGDNTFTKLFTQKIQNKEGLKQ